jgi:3-methyl-2-oxobutanoate hydroxymethyltransferase
MPQRASLMGRYRIKGRKAENVIELLKSAISLEKAGAFSVVLECITAEAAQTITNRIRIPSIGIGAGPHCDGQVLVINDLLGINKKAPSFVKRYADLHETILEALEKYCEEVKDGHYPNDDFTVRMTQEENNKLKAMLEKK